VSDVKDYLPLRNIKLFAKNTVVRYLAASCNAAVAAAAAAIVSSPVIIPKASKFNDVPTKGDG